MSDEKSYTYVIYGDYFINYEIRIPFFDQPVFQMESIGTLGFFGFSWLMAFWGFPRPLPRDAARSDSSLSLLSSARLELMVSVSGAVTMALASLIRSGLALKGGKSQRGSMLFFFFVIWKISKISIFSVYMG